MNNIVTIAIIIFGLLGVVLIVIENVFGKKESEAFPYEKKPLFLTQTELDFFRALLRVIEDKYCVFCQVRVGSILQVKWKGIKLKERKKYDNKINQKSFDFVVFDTETLNALLIIELDDSTHFQSKRIDRDGFIDGALKAAQIPILHINPQSNYNIEELRAQILNELAPIGKE